MNQKGYVGLVLTIFALLMGILIFPMKFPSRSGSSTSGFQFCREFITDPNAPTIEVALKDVEGITLSPATFKMIKQNVPVRENGLIGGHHASDMGVFTAGGVDYKLFDPALGVGKSYDFNTEDGIIDVSFAEFGLLFLVHLDASGVEKKVEVGGEMIMVMDIYQDIAKPPVPQSEKILKCTDVGESAEVSAQVVVPSQNPSLDKEQLQLEWFLLKQNRVLPSAWWTPECKPAVYLYPEKKSLVNVKVSPLGELAYTDPLYDFSRGWTVWAEPTGDLYQVSISRFQEEKRYDYLYYESKIYDWEIKKPEEGWVVKYDELERLYEEILPKLGLNAQEKADFTGYWLEKLPRSEYYFVGVIDKTQRDHIEPLSVIPEPETSIRFSLYFEPLEEFKVVSEPMIITPVRKGFTLVDWGGMVKLHPGTPFTCSQ